MPEQTEELDQLKKHAATLAQQLQASNERLSTTNNQLIELKVSGYDRLTNALEQAEQAQNQFTGFVQVLGKALGIPGNEVNPELVLNTVKSLGAPGD